MQTNPAAKQNKNVKWSKSPWNQSGGREKSMVEVFRFPRNMLVSGLVSYRMECSFGRDNSHYSVEAVTF